MKKKSVLLCLLLGLFFNLLGQSTPPLKITLEPSKSFGFLGWTAQPNSTYIINITQKRVVSGQVTYSPVSTLRSSTNYLKMDKTLLKQPDLYYSVSAMAANGTTIGQTEPAAFCPECTPNTWTCSKTCNGTTYAYTLNITAEDLGVGQTSMGRVWISDAYSAVAPNANAGNYYYEAITPTEFTIRGAYITAHNLDWYVMSNVVSTDQIRDANNNVLTGTVYFVQKTLGQFSWADGNRTTDFLVDQSNCSLNFMINRMNQFPSPDNNNTGILQCFPAWPSQAGAGGGLVNKPYNGPGSLADVLVTYYTLSYYIIDCNDDLSEELCVHFGCSEPWEPEPGEGTGGNLPTAPDFGDGKLLYVKVSNVNDPDMSITLTPDQIFDYGREYIAPSLKDLESGLYRMTFVFDDFSAAQFLAEHHADTYEPITNSDFATLTVSPNPIQNETLIYDVTVNRNMSFDIEVYSLAGDFISTEHVKLLAGESLRRQKSLPKKNYPYSQVRVKLVFADGSVQEQIVELPQ
ncbi:hypothetical protein [Fluviicola sp.]|uniref:hypothetical protein n=1 Tax=Fluviicola sp. TaxID=1917219 RepID=UPI0031D88671